MVFGERSRSNWKKGCYEFSSDQQAKHENITWLEGVFGLNHVKLLWEVVRVCGNNNLEHLLKQSPKGVLQNNSKIVVKFSEKTENRENTSDKVAFLQSC